MSDDKKKPRLLCVFYSEHTVDEDVLGEALAWALDVTDMRDRPFALVGPSRDNYWTRVWLDPNPQRGMRVSGGCWSGSLIDVDTYGLSTDEDEEDDDTRQEDIIALIKDAAKWVEKVSKQDN